MAARILSPVSSATGWSLFLRIATIAIAVVAVSHVIPVRVKLGIGGRHRVLSLPIWMTGLVASVLVIGGFAYVFGSAGTAASAGIHYRRRAGRARPQGATGDYIGVYEPLEFRSYQSVAGFGSAIGRKPSLVLYYSGWNEPFQSQFARTASAHGAIPMVDMEPFGVRLAAIAAGRYDSYLRNYARAVRGYRRPVALSFAPEANGYWDTWGWTHTPPGVWVAAWRHIVDVFRMAGAANARWVWTMNRTTARTGPLRAYWPGSRYVTWVGIDGYYFRRTDTFQRVFAPTITTVRVLTSKPVLLSEVGIGQVAGQARKIPDLFAGIRRYHLIGLIWFDVAQHAGLYKQNWQLEGHPAALAAFRRGIASLPNPGGGQTHTAEAGAGR